MRNPSRPTACMLGYFMYETDARIQNYVKPLVESGYNVDVIGVGQKSYTITNDNGCIVNVISVGERSKKEKERLIYLFNIALFFFHAMLIVTSRFFRYRYKFIHVHNVPDVLVFTTIVPKAFGARVFLDIHDVLPEFYAKKFGVDMDGRMIRMIKYAEKISCRFADHVIIANEIWKEKVIKRVGLNGKCTAILNFPDSKLFYPRFPLVPVKKEGEPFILFYQGTYSDFHGLDVAICATDILRNMIGPFKLILYGGGAFEPEMRKLVEELNLDSIVTINGAVPYETLREVMKDADIGIVPKKDGIFVGDAISTKLFQYASMGLPAVVSRAPAERKYFEEDEVQFFKPGDPEDMAKSIKYFYDNRDEMAKYARRALDKCVKYYNLDRNSIKYFDIINTIC